MKRLSELLSKPIISLYEGKTEGTIKNAVFNKNLTKLKWLVLFDDKDILEEKYLPAKDIFSVGENAVVIKNSQAIMPNLPEVTEQKHNNPINTLIYTPQGNLVDVVADVLLDDKNMIEKIELKAGKNLNPSQIVVNGQDTLILQDEKNPVNISSFKEKGFPKTGKTTDKRKVQIMQVNEEVNKEIAEQIGEEKVNKTINKESRQAYEPKIKQKKIEKKEKNVKVKTLVKEKLPAKTNSNNKAKKTNSPQKSIKAEEKFASEKVKPILKNESVTESLKITNDIKETSDKIEREQKEQLAERTTKLEKEVKKSTKTNPFKEFTRRENAKTQDETRTKLKERIQNETPKPAKATNFNFEASSATPNIIFAGNNFLLNRTSLKNIYTLNNEIIIKAGEQITKQKIDKALICGKLQELIKYSK
jgi:uncharacterized protein YrrD